MGKTLRGIGITLAVVFGFLIVFGGILFGLYEYSQKEKAEAEKKKSEAVRAEQQRLAEQETQKREEERLRREKEQAAAKAEQDRQFELARKQESEAAQQRLTQAVPRQVAVRTTQPAQQQGIPYWLKGNPMTTLSGEITAITGEGPILTVRTTRREYVQPTPTVGKNSNGTLSFGSRGGGWVNVPVLLTYTIKGTSRTFTVSSQSITVTGVTTTGLGGGNIFYMD